MAQNENRTRVLLLMGIVVSVAVSIVLHIRLAEKRDAVESAQNDPGRRAALALQDADRAIVNGAFDGATNHLQKALAATDEALEMRPGTLQLERNRLLLTRRLAVVAQKMGRGRVACEHLQASAEQAVKLFELEPTNSRMRGELLATAREWASEDACPSAPVLKALRHAATATDRSAETVPRIGTIRVLSARTWLDIAKFEITEDKAAAVTAARKALALSQKRAEDEHDPVSAASTAYAIVGGVVSIATEAKDAAAQIEFERAAISILEKRARLSPDDSVVIITLGVRRSRLADFVEEAGQVEEAEAIHQTSIEGLRAAFAKFKTNLKVRKYLVRSLNSKAAFYSGLKKNREALDLYAEAVGLATKLGPDARRTRLVLLGNHAHLLGRLDQTRKARTIAGKAYELALEVVGEGQATSQARGDAVNAGLRYARLLRARPGANRSRARTVARTERTRLRSLEGKQTKRLEGLAKGLDGLLAELR